MPVFVCNGVLLAANLPQRGFRQGIGQPEGYEIGCCLALQVGQITARSHLIGKHRPDIYYYILLMLNYRGVAPGLWPVLIRTPSGVIEAVRLAGQRPALPGLVTAGLVSRRYRGNLRQVRLVADFPFGMISGFLLNGVSSAASRSRYSAFPKMLRRNSCAF